MKKKLTIRLTLPRVFLALLLVFIGVQVIILFHLQLQASGSEAPTKSLNNYAEKVFATCKPADYRPSCYDREIPKLMKTLSMEDTFAVTKIVQDMDPTYTYCHILGHKLSSIEVAKDPSRWKDVVTRCPSGVCSNGCIHGGFEQRFRKQMFSDADIQKYKPDLEGICEERNDWHPTGVEQASCYHAVGHLTMYITNAEIIKALSLCDDIAKKPGGRDYTMLCYDGAFMQIFQPLEVDDFALVEGKQPTKDTAYSYCSSFTLPEQASCINESWPLFRKEIMTPQGFLDHCSHSPTAFGRNYCYMTLAYIVTPNLQFDPQRTSVFCNALPEEASLTCFRNAATRMIETDTRNIPKALSLCNVAGAKSTKDACYQELASRSGYYLGNATNERETLCSSMPTEWRAICRQ